MKQLGHVHHRPMKEKVVGSKRSVGWERMMTLDMLSEVIVWRVEKSR